MSERCLRCDDARCEVPSASAATVGIPGFGEDCSEADNAKWSQLGLAMRDCWKRPAVDWRARALAAETARDEALVGWRSLWDSECCGDPPEELTRLIRESGVDMEYVNGRWRAARA